VEPIVVTGIGLVTPLGTGRAEVWRAFCAGDSGIRELGDDDPRRDRAVDPSPLPDIGRAGWVRGFQPREHIRSPLLRRMDWGSRMLVAATRQAFADAALLPLDPRTKESTALVVGSCLASQRDTTSYLERIFGSGLAAGQPFVFPNLVLNAASGYAAIELELAGPNLSLSEHEASGEAALAAAADLLRGGVCEAACAGGFDELGGVLVDALAARRIIDLGSLPAARRASARAAGRGLGGRIVPGEGAAMLLLETAARARERGARIYAELACARTAAVDAAPYALARNPDTAAERLVDIAFAALGDPAAEANEGGQRPVVSAVLGNSDGSAPRDALDAATLRAIGRRQVVAPAYVPFRRLAGEWGAAGALGAALAALTVDAGGLPGANAGETGPAPGKGASATLLVGAGRGGVIAPLVFVPRRSA
jgi:3-oxoacyl-(acyl-carrier-protein) synthase